MHKQIFSSASDLCHLSSSRGVGGSVMIGRLHYASNQVPRCGGRVHHVGVHV